MQKIATIMLLLVGLVPIFTAACATSNDNQGGGLDGGGDATFGPAPSSSTPAVSCNPQFCPAMGFGDPCCVSQAGPCGMDMGMGCIHVVPGNPDGG